MTVQGDAAAPLPTLRRRSAFGRAWDWFFGSSRILRAQALVLPLDAEQLELLGRGRRARELAQRILDPVEPLAGGPALDLALELHRQAAYWLLLSFTPRSPRPSEDELWADSSNLLARVGPFPEHLAELFRRRSAFVSFADASVLELRTSAEMMRDFVDALLALVDNPTVDLERLRLFRIARIVLTPVVLVVIGWLAVTLLVPVRPDLARGKPWKASSALHECHPDIGDCGGVKTRILFHTQEEASPWFEYDMGGPVTFSGVTVRNRMDYGQDRAVPLVLEVSPDGKTYREIARRTKTFGVWETTFPKTTGRFVRLRATRRTFLHFESVKVHP